MVRLCATGSISLKLSCRWRRAVSRPYSLDRLRPRLYSVLELGPTAGRLGTTISWILICLIAATLTATVMESVPRLANAYGKLFDVVEYAALTVFSIEYLARLWTAAEHPPWRRLGA